MVQRYVFDQVDDPRLHGFLVWGPMLDKEERADAVKATRFLNDTRTTHFWTDDDVLAARFRAPVGLPEEELAWDTFLLFAPGQRWGETPPRPAFTMHVNKSLPEELRLHGPTLRDHVRQMLDALDRGDGSAATGKAARGDGHR